MSYQERKTLVSLISTIVVSAVYFFVVYQNYQALDFETANLLGFWGTVILILVPVQVIAKVIIFVVYIILDIIVTRRQEPDITDELENLIELKSTRNFYHSFMLGFFIAMAAIAFGMSLTGMFLIFLTSITIAAIIGDASQLYYYRRGV